MLASVARGGVKGHLLGFGLQERTTISEDMMTTELVPTVAQVSAADVDESVVAVTLSWPLKDRSGANNDGQVLEGAHIVELIGDIDAHLVARVTTMLSAVAAQSAELLVDVSEVRFIDANGLGLLVSMHRHVSASGGRMNLIGTRPGLARLLHITQLDRLLGTA
jgi:anti-anti-sigma factor